MLFTTLLRLVVIFISNLITGLTDAAKLWVSKVIQKAFIEVNEEGSEAAAATAANLCEYFVTIHAQHKIRGIRDASSSGSCRSSLIFVD